MSKLSGLIDRLREEGNKGFEFAGVEGAVRLDHYQGLASATAVYPDRGNNLFYPVMGLCGEVGELVEKVTFSKWNVVREDVLREAGDVCWYIAAVCSEIKVWLSAVGDRAAEKKQEFPPLTVNQLTVQSGKVAERAKKIMRDRAGVCDADSREEIVEALAVIMIMVERLCVGVEGTLGGAMEGNLKKLKRRQEEGRIKGEGDNR